MEMAIMKGIVWIGWQKVKTYMLISSLTNLGIKTGLTVYKAYLPSVHEFYFRNAYERYQQAKQEQP